MSDLILSFTSYYFIFTNFYLETFEYYIIRAKATILATGGSGRLHLSNYPTTNHYGATGDGLIMAYHVGTNLLSYRVGLQNVPL